MTLLIDTHSLIWYVDQEHLLSRTAYDAIADRSNELMLSACVLWEIAIKVGLKKLSLSLGYREWMDKATTDLDLKLLPISLEFSEVQVGLPPHHRDPFDRMLVSQSLVLRAPIVSRDSRLDPYGIVRIW